MGTLFTPDMGNCFVTARLKYYNKMCHMKNVEIQNARPFFCSWCNASKVGLPRIDDCTTFSGQLTIHLARCFLNQKVLCLGKSQVNYMQAVQLYYFKTHPSIYFLYLLINTWNVGVWVHPGEVTSLLQGPFQNL